MVAFLFRWSISAVRASEAEPTDRVDFARFSFACHFYRSEPMRSLSDILSDIMELEWSQGDCLLGLHVCDALL